MRGGHGHVRPRPDGAKARCGGPGLCAECSREAAGLTAPERREPERWKAVWYDVADHFEILTDDEREDFIVALPPGESRQLRHRAALLALSPEWPAAMRDLADATEQLLGELDSAYRGEDAARDAASAARALLDLLPGGEG